MWNRFWTGFDNWRNRCIYRVTDYHPVGFIVVVLAIVMSPMIAGYALGYPDIGRTFQSLTMFCCSILAGICTWRDHIEYKKRRAIEDAKWEAMRLKDIPPYEGF